MEMLNEFKNIISFVIMFLIAFIWVETTFVNAGEFKNYQTQNYIFRIEYLKDKRERLDREGKQLSYEDKRALERTETQLQRLQHDKSRRYLIDR